MTAHATRIIRTPDQRLRVFVSSTLQELSEERQAAWLKSWALTLDQAMALALA